jgi:chromosome segregation ATPase
MSGFSPLGPHSLESDNGDSFWPAFTDIMTVVVLIFLMATSLLIVRNYKLVADLQNSIEAERLASQVIESTTQENATLEERLTNAEQLNSLLRLKLLKKDELLAKAKTEEALKLDAIERLKAEKTQLNRMIQQRQASLVEARQQIEVASAEAQDFANQLDELKLQLTEQKQLAEAAQQELELATAEIAALNASTEQQRQNIEMLEQEKIEYNRQLLTLKGEYDVVKSKYDELIKPARSAKGKYVAEVFYQKKGGEVIRFKEPGETRYRDMLLPQVEKRLTQLKKEKGKQLYVKIIIPKDSGLTYNEAWGFMKRLLDKYDYYYQSTPETDKAK